MARQKHFLAGHLAQELGLLDRRPSRLEAAMGLLVGRSSGPEAALGEGGEGPSRLKAALGLLGGRVSGPEAPLGEGDERPSRLKAALGLLGGRSGGPEAALGEGDERPSRLKAALGLLGGRSDGPEAALGEGGGRPSRLKAALGLLGGRVSGPEAAQGEGGERSSGPEAAQGEGGERSSGPKAALGKRGGRPGMEAALGEGGVAALLELVGAAMQAWLLVQCYPRGHRITVGGISGTGALDASAARLQLLRAAAHALPFQPRALPGLALPFQGGMQHRLTSRSHVAIAGVSRLFDDQRHSARMAVSRAAPFKQALLRNLAMPNVLLTCRPGVVAAGCASAGRGAERAAAGQGAQAGVRVVVREDVVVSG
jgi:hypothetical protein